MVMTSQEIAEISSAMFKLLPEALEGMSYQDALKLVDPRLLNQAFTWAIEEALILKLQGKVCIPSFSDKFVARDKFVGGDVDRISYLCPNFKKLFLDKEEEPAGAAELSYFYLNKSSPHTAILAALGSKAETTLASVYYLMNEHREVFHRGYANIFYVRDNSQMLHSLMVCLGLDGWQVSILFVEPPLGLFLGHRIFVQPQS